MVGGGTIQDHVNAIHLDPGHVRSQALQRLHQVVCGLLAIEEDKWDDALGRLGLEVAKEGYQN